MSDTINFKDLLFVDYPIPRTVSIWNGNAERGVTSAIKSLDDLIKTCVRELSSDVQITDYMVARGLVTHMPEGTVTVQSAMLNSNYYFQGNRLVKLTYDKGKNIVFLRYYPATLTYKRRLTVEDLDNSNTCPEGDKFRYIKLYILWHMAEAELQILKSVNMQVDNGQVDFSVLEKFAADCKAAYNELKQGILIYASAY